MALRCGWCNRAFNSESELERFVVVDGIAIHADSVKAHRAVRDGKVSEEDVYLGCPDCMTDAYLKKVKAQIQSGNIFDRDWDIGWQETSDHSFIVSGKDLEGVLAIFDVMPTSEAGLKRAVANNIDGVVSELRARGYIDISETLSRRPMAPYPVDHVTSPNRAPTGSGPNTKAKPRTTPRKTSAKRPKAAIKKPAPSASKPRTTAKRRC